MKHPNVFKGSDLNESFKVQSSSNSLNQSDTLLFNLMPKGFNFGYLNIQGISGKNMCKFSEIKAILTSQENSSLHIFGTSETKLKPHKLSTCFNIDGFQTPFRKENDSNGGGVLLFMSGMESMLNSELCRGLAAASACGSFWTFLFTFLI